MTYPFYMTAETKAKLEDLSRISGQRYDSMNVAALCAASMLVERMCDLSFPPELAARLALQCGALQLEQDFDLFAGAVSGSFSLSHRSISDTDEAFATLRPGGMAILRTPGMGTGRYAVLCPSDDSQVWLLDPSYQRGRGIPRTQKRALRQQNEYLTMPFDIFTQLYMNADTVFHLYTARPLA